MKQACLQKGRRLVDEVHVLQAPRDPTVEEETKPRTEEEKNHYDEYKASSKKPRKSSGGSAPAPPTGNRKRLATTPKGNPSKKSKPPRRKRQDDTSSEESSASSSSTESESEQSPSESESESSSSSSSESSIAVREKKRKHKKKPNSKHKRPKHRSIAQDFRHKRPSKHKREPQTLTLPTKPEVVDASDSDDDHLVDVNIKEKPKNYDLANIGPIPISVLRWCVGNKLWQMSDDHRDIALSFVHITEQNFTLRKEEEGNGSDDSHVSVLKKRGQNQRRAYPLCQPHFLKITQKKKTHKTHDQILFDLREIDDIATMHYHVRGGPLIIRIQTKRPLPAWAESKLQAAGENPAEASNRSWAISFAFTNTPEIRKSVQEAVYLLNYYYSEHMPGSLTSVPSGTAHEMDDSKSYGKLSLIYDTTRTKRSCHGVNIWSAEPLCTIDGIDLTRGDWNRLYPEMYFSENLVQVWTNKMARDSATSKSKFCILPPSFFKKLQKAYESGKIQEFVDQHGSTFEESHFEAPFLLFPARIGNHWMLILGCWLAHVFYFDSTEEIEELTRQPKIWVFDGRHVKGLHASVVVPLREFLVKRLAWEKDKGLLKSLETLRDQIPRQSGKACSTKERTAKFDADRLTPKWLPARIAPGIHKQPDRTDCGVLTCKMMEYLIENPLDNNTGATTCPIWTGVELAGKRQSIAEWVIKEGKMDPKKVSALQQAKAGWMQRRLDRKMRQVADHASAKSKQQPQPKKEDPKKGGL